MQQDAGRDAGAGGHLAPKIRFVLGLDDADIAGERELGLVVLEFTRNLAGLCGGQGRLRLDDGQVVGDAGGEAVGGVLQLLGGEGDVAARDLDQFRGGLDVEQAVADLLVDGDAEVGDLGADAADLGVCDLTLAAQGAFFEDGELELALCDKVAVVEAVGSRRGRRRSRRRRALGGAGSGPPWRSTDRRRAAPGARDSRRAG